MIRVSGVFNFAIGHDSHSHRLCGRLHHDGGPIGEDFGDALHDLSGVVASADHRIRSEIPSMFEHQIESFGARFFAKIGQQCDVAADQRLQSRSDGSKMERERTTIPRTTPSVRTTR